MREYFISKKEKDPVWALPGGKIAVLEKGKDTINRELNEEIGEPVEVSNLYNVVPIEIKDALKEIIDANEQNVVKSKIRR